jgi:hypothetical protein
VAAGDAVRVLTGVNFIVDITHHRLIARAAKPPHVGTFDTIGPGLLDFNPVFPVQLLLTIPAISCHNLSFLDRV